MKQQRFPGTFCVGSNILEDFSEHISCYGKDVFFIGGKRALANTKTQLEASFEKSETNCTFVECGKIPCLSEIERISVMPELTTADIVCAVGGGSCMDIARTIANRMGKSLVMLPTTVASDAPCSCVSVFYSDDGSKVVGDELFHKCADMIMVDSKVIADAPARHLASGMGDALATFYEATTCKNNSNGKYIANTPMLYARICREMVLRDGYAAYLAVENHIVTPQLENVIEANCFLSGVGGANTGCAAAHGIGDYLCNIEGGHDFMHGERVYIGLMIQMILEQYPKEEIIHMMQFGKKMGLPLSIKDMGVIDVNKTAAFMSKELQDDHFMLNLCCDFSKNVLAGAIVSAVDMTERI